MNRLRQVLRKISTAFTQAHCGLNVSLSREREHTQNDEMYAVLKLLGEIASSKSLLSCSSKSSEYWSGSPWKRYRSAMCVRLCVKQSKTPLCEERRVCGRWRTGGLVKMKIVVCRSTMFIWIRLQHVHTHTRRRQTRLRWLGFAVCMCRRCKKKKRL